MPAAPAVTVFNFVTALCFFLLAFSSGPALARKRVPELPLDDYYGDDDGDNDREDDLGHSYLPVTSSLWQPPPMPPAASRLLDGTSSSVLISQESSSSASISIGFGIGRLQHPPPEPSPVQPLDVESPAVTPPRLHTSCSFNSSYYATAP